MSLNQFYCSFYFCDSMITSALAQIALQFFLFARYIHKSKVVHVYPKAHFNEAYRMI